MSLSVSDGKNEADTAIIMVTLNPIIDQQILAPKFSHVNFLFFLSNNNWDVKFSSDFEECS